jgi:hypothetical protein
LPLGMRRNRTSAPGRQSQEEAVGVTPAGFFFVLPEYLIGKGHALRVMLNKPPLRGILRGEHPEMILVANLLAGIDVNPNSAHELGPTILFALCLF